jgi:transposase
MTRIYRENLKVRILKLADMQSTGSPDDLAFRFSVSKRTVKRIVSEIRVEGHNIRYSPSIKSYVTEKECV